jgi:hypothetical protein
MLTSAEIGKQNGDTRTRKPGYLNLSNVTFRLNEVLGKFYNWCTFNFLTPHPGKTEYMLIGKKKFIGPLRGIRLGDYCIKRVFRNGSRR